MKCIRSFYYLTCFCLLLVVSAQAQPLQSTLNFSADPIITSIDLESEFFGYQSAVNRDFTGGQLAYDYSVNVIFDQSESKYRMYSGGRWIGAGPGGSGDGDHILQHTSSSGLGNTWSMPHFRPEFPQGQEEGLPGQWFSNNYLEPEVLKLGSTYYMYSQVQVNPGSPIDLPGQTAVTQADRIQLHTSTDGDNWTRWATQPGNPNRGVIINLDDPTRTNLHHQEVVYVPWDEDNKPYWMYVFGEVNGVLQGYQRIRSDDPTTFDWQDRQTAGLAQLGNQIGYLNQGPGAKMLVRSTFTDNGSGRQVPSLQFSRDGLNWFLGDEGPALLDGSKNNVNNQNTYFLGLSTLDGLGEIEYLGNNQYRAIYAASTSSSPIAPDIFHSEIGVGELTFTVNAPTFGGLQRTDTLVYRANTNTWLGSHTATAPVYLSGSTTTQANSFGNSLSIPLVGDVDGDGLDDIVRVENNSGFFQWTAGHTVVNANGVGSFSTTSTSSISPFGFSGGNNDGVFLGDVNGDGADDAITINTGFNWFSNLSGIGTGLGGGGVQQGPVQFGLPGDQPIVGDFDGDGFQDIGVYRVNGGNIFWNGSAGGVLGAGGLGPIGQIGGNGGQDSLLIGDLNGDGFDDAVMVRQDGAGMMEWFSLINDGTGFLDFFNPGTSNVFFGLDNGSDTPIVADINGDGRADIGTIRDDGSGNLVWRFAFTAPDGTPTNYTAASATFGLTGDIPLFGQFDTIAPMPGDFDLEADVDGSDFLAWQRGFGIISAATLAQGDADADGDVDGNDLGIWEDQFGTSPAIAASSSATVVPEPSSLALVAFGLSTLVRSARRRQWVNG